MPFGRERLGALDVVAVVAVAAVDDDVALLHACRELVRRCRRRTPPAPSPRRPAACASFATKSSSELAPVAPSCSSAFTASALTSIDDALVPALASGGARCWRPSGPGPTIPSCMTAPFVLVPTEARARSPRGSPRGRRRRPRRGGFAAPAGRARPAPGSRPRAWAAFTTPNVYFSPGHGQVVGVVAGDLQEHARVRPALVGLAGRVQEAGPEADAGRRSRAVPDRAPDLGRAPARARRSSRCRRAAPRSRRRSTRPRCAARISSSESPPASAAELRRVALVREELQAAVGGDRLLRRQRAGPLVRSP